MSIGLKRDRSQTNRTAIGLVSREARASARMFGGLTLAGAPLKGAAKRELERFRDGLKSLARAVDRKS